MTFANLPQDYEAKKKRMDKALNLQIPDRVPILIQSLTWGYSYTKTKLMDVRSDRLKNIHGGIDFCKDIYSDSIFTPISGVSMELQVDVLKPIEPQYGISEDGYSLQHYERAVMLPEEYPQLIDDPRKYIKEVMLPRRYPILNEAYPANYNVLKKAYASTMEFIATMVDGEKIAKKEYGMPVFLNGGCYVPPDFMFDFFRGFKGVLGDLRRYPDQFAAACDKLTDYVIDIKCSQLKKGDILFTPLHMATYMNPKQFEKFYWPSFKKVVDATIKKGARPVLYLENDWTPYMEYLLQFPKNTISVIIEYGDMKNIKQKYGSHMSIIGGMPCEKLRYCTVQESVDYAKKVIDIMAPGGGFIFSTDKILLCPNDINVENYLAVVETVKEYGKY